MPSRILDIWVYPEGYFFIPAGISIRIGSFKAMVMKVSWHDNGHLAMELDVELPIMVAANAVVTLEK